MKKVSLLAAAALMSTFLVACEGKKEKPAEETQAPKVNEQTEAPKQETTEAPKIEEKVTGKIQVEESPKEEVEKVKEKVSEVKEQVQEKTEKVVEQVKEEVAEKIPKEEAPQTETKSVQKIDGRKLFSSKGCTVCHKEKLDTVGPSLAKISSKYNGDKDKLIKFLKGKHPAIVDPARYTMMKPQISITKQMSDAELDALADYILGVK